VALVGVQEMPSFRAAGRSGEQAPPLDTPPPLRAQKRYASPGARSRPLATDARRRGDAVIRGDRAGLPLGGARCIRT